MSELANALGTLRNLPLSCIKYPSGRYGFVGSVPEDLAYTCSDPELLKVARHSGARIAQLMAARTGQTFKTRTWDTEEQAVAEARRLGYLNA